MEQIDQLAGAGQISEALTSLKRLVDQSQGRLIEVGKVQRAATLSVQLHLPIAEWAQWRLAAWSDQYPEKLTSVRRTDEELAGRALQSIGGQLKASALRELVERYSLAPSATEARLMLCDLYLDRGWTVAARQSLDGPSTGWRARSSDAMDHTPGDGLPWVSAWPRLSLSKSVSQLLDQSWQSVRAPYRESTDALRLALIKRVVSTTALDGTGREMQSATQWPAALGQRLPTVQRGQLEASLRQSQQWYEQRTSRSDAATEVAATFAGNNARRGTVLANEAEKLDVGSWTKWTKPLERMTGQLDRNPASKPPVAEGGSGILPYYPIVHDGKVFVHELTRITAFDVRTGKSWPPTEPAMPLYDSGATAATFFPFGYRPGGSTARDVDDRR